MFVWGGTGTTSNRIEGAFAGRQAFAFAAFEEFRAISAGAARRGGWDVGYAGAGFTRSCIAIGRVDTGRVIGFGGVIT